MLILRDLDDADLRALLRTAAELGLDTLVEAHDAEELDRAVALGAPVIGINARDLSTFRIDRAAQLALVARARATGSSSPSPGCTRVRREQPPSSRAPTRSSSAPR